MNFILLVASMCSKPIVENKTKYSWNDFDNWSLNNAIKNCPVMYKNSPCLKKFIKVNKQDYHAICGRKE